MWRCPPPAPFLGPPAEQDFVCIVERIIKCLCTITQIERYEPLGYEYDVRELLLDKDEMAQAARALLVRIPEDQRPYAIGRARQRVYDCEWSIVTEDNDLSDMLGSTPYVIEDQ